MKVTKPYYTEIIKQISISQSPRQETFWFPIEFERTEKSEPEKQKNQGFKN